MKTPALALGLSLAVQIVTGARAQDGVIDLTALANYASQPVPAYITKNNTPQTNPITDAGATLGRVLFYDKRLSRNDTVSCSSCHRQDRAFSDTATASTGVNGTTARHSMRLVNGRFGSEPRFFWDERASSLENQTTQPVKDHAEMGFSGANGDPAFADLVVKLAAVPEYRVLFTIAFGSIAIDETRLQRALAQFVRSIQSFDSRYDAGRAVAPDAQAFPNFSAGENDGKQLFLRPQNLGGAGCAGCHRPPEFDIDPNSRNNGITAAINGGVDLTNTRSPSLRDLVGPAGQSNGAFMHNGGLASLALVVDHYNAIPAGNPNLDPRLRLPGGAPQNLNLTAQARADLVAFLQTLSGSAVYTEGKWSNPFGAAGQLSLNVVARAGMIIETHADGSATLSCKAVRGFQYDLQFSTDLQNWTTLETLAPDVNGNLSALVSTAGTVFYRFAFTAPGA